MDVPGWQCVRLNTPIRVRFDPKFDPFDGLRQRPDRKHTQGNWGFSQTCIIGRVYPHRHHAYWYIAAWAVSAFIFPFQLQWSTLWMWLPLSVVFRQHHSAYARQFHHFEVARTTFLHFKKIKSITCFHFLSLFYKKIIESQDNAAERELQTMLWYALLIRWGLCSVCPAFLSPHKEVLTFRLWIRVQSSVLSTRNNKNKTQTQQKIKKE